MSKDKKSGDVVDFRLAGEKADSRRIQQREAKAKDLQKRFSAARNAAEPKTSAAERLKKLFKKPPEKP